MEKGRERERERSGGENRQSQRVTDEQSVQGERERDYVSLEEPYDSGIATATNS